MDRLAGITFPGHGKAVFKEDWEHEQETKAQEIIDRDFELHGWGIVEGGAIAAGAGPNTIDFTETVIAYNADGQRIVVDPAPTAIPVPADATSTIVLRHAFAETENTAPNNPGEPIIWRENSYEVVARQGSLQDGDVPIREVTASGGTVTPGADLRTRKGISGAHIQLETIEDGHIAADQITNAKLAAANKTGVLTDLLTAIYDGISGAKTFAKAINWVADNYLSLTEAASTYLTQVDAASTYALAFPSGTRLLFQQTVAPTGWTKITTHNDKALRVVSGTAGSGGTNSFSSRLNASVSTAGGAVQNHTLTTADIPSHSHGIQLFAGAGGSTGPWQVTNAVAGSVNTYSTGSGEAHSHGFTNPSFNLDVQYVDVIIAEKN